MEVVQPPNKEFLEKGKELNKKGNHFFILSDKETMNNKVYTINNSLFLMELKGQVSSRVLFELFSTIGPYS
ncbi:hypothetical protein [Peribacillus frigoritolerans]|uniref:hypothetical protein n=1 Tax=Peribacillus frigoritolerans TaxID=450367 RepID=UPI0025A306AB|nr:hypothetical protein [Peribacillus frigoritolerans]MDM5308489.1 hypothetical protein [Peribacillus frigoritolerans]MED4690689.1 hypothetical protein [Peribacillus frigoritolerans]